MNLALTAKSAASRKFPSLQLGVAVVNAADLNCCPLKDNPEEEPQRQPEMGQTASFHTTSWNLILQAGEADSAESGAALELLCRIYWKPLFVFARAQGRSPHDAEDATQGFFGHPLCTKGISKADPARGKFRTFLLSSFKHFLGQEWKRNNAQKRGGGAQFVVFDELSAADLNTCESAGPDSPDAQFDRRYATALIETTLQRLENEYSSREKQAQFQVAKPFIVCEDDKLSYASLAGKLAVEEGNARIIVYRLRHRFREIFREEVLRTLQHPGELDEEMRDIQRVLGS